MLIEKRSVAARGSGDVQYVKLTIGTARLGLCSGRM
jgi:hypothetical protein